MKNNIAVFLLAISLISLSTLACTSKKDRTEQQNSTAENLAASDTNIAFADSKGNKLSLGDLKGKVVFINFWATWCPPCIAEMPSINNLYKRYRDKSKITFIMVDVDANFQKSKSFMDKNNYDLPLYIPASQIPSNFLSGAIPTTVILDKSGKMVGRIEGSREYDSQEVYDALDSLIKE